MRPRALRSGSAARTLLPRRAAQALYLCASLNPALAGLPLWMEYAWTYLITVWHPAST